MPTRPYPENPSLENFKKQAKKLYKDVRAGDVESIALVREFHPRANDVISNFSLAQAQLVTARSYRFPSWPKLKQHLQLSETFKWDPPAERAGLDSLRETFLRLSCLAYDGWWRPPFAERARRLLEKHPELIRADISTAAAIGDVSTVRAMLTDDPGLVNRKGGPFNWEPLLYACYSRFNSADRNHSTLEVARLLLKAGADPNAGFLWKGLIPPFTALTGAFGNGEAGANEPPHQHCEALARLLLEAGADPNDDQTLYNRHGQPNDDHLKLLLSYGLGQDKGGPWFKRFGDLMLSPQRMLTEQLWSAARRNFFERVRLLVEHGTDVNTPGFRDGRTPYEAAMRAGNHEIAEYLVQHGANKKELDVKEAFAAACINGHPAEARALLQRNPKLMEDLGKHGRIELLHRAVEANRPEGIRLMSELGFEFSTVTHHDGVGINLAATPMHNAAWLGNLEMVKLLVALGADATVRDPNYNSTPLGWALYNRQRHVVGYLVELGTIFDALQAGAVERAVVLLKNDPSLAKIADNRGYPLIFYLDPDAPRLEEMIQLLRDHGADLNAQSKEGMTALDFALKRGHTELAEVLRRHGAKEARGLSRS